MFRKLGLFALASSLLALGQTPMGVVVNSGTVTPVMPGAPLITTPNVALPGSGPATGLPPAVGVNDARYGGAGSVFQPSGGTLTGSELPGTPAPIVVTGGLQTGTSNTNKSGTLNVGMGAFMEGPLNQPEASLADIARQYKSQRANANPRQFDNNNIRHASYGTSNTNSAALPQSDQPSATYGSSGASPNAEGVLDQRDYAAVQAALTRTQAAANASQSNSSVASSMPDPSSSLTPYEATGNSTDQQSNATQSQGRDATQSAANATTPQIQSPVDTDSAPRKKQLPASASFLPLLALFGLITCGVGGMFNYKLRRAKI